MSSYVKIFITCNHNFIKPMYTLCNIMSASSFFLQISFALYLCMLAFKKCIKCFAGCVFAMHRKNMSLLLRQLWLSTPLDPIMGNYEILILAINCPRISPPNAEHNINWYLPPNVYRTHSVYFKDIILTNYILTFISVSII